MKIDRKVILYIAQSLDGYIAREDHDISWLSIVEQDGEDYGYADFIATVDTVIMGRKTYEKVLSFGIDFPHKDKKCYILSHSKQGYENNVEFYSGDVALLINRLKAVEGKNIFVDGGAEAIKELRGKNLIDEYVISVIPIMLGKGIRLFKDVAVESKLHFVDAKTYKSGLVQLKYKRIL